MCKLHYTRWLTGSELAAPLPPDRPRMSPADIQRISDAVDAACPRFILIVHPNFKLPEGFHMKPLDRSQGRGLR